MRCTKKVIVDSSDIGNSNTIDLYDTSSIIEASNRGAYIEAGCTIPAIYDEMQNFLPGNGRNGAHIKQDYLNLMSIKLPASNVNASYRMNVRGAVIATNEMVNQGKKTKNDTISLPDVALVTTAIMMAVDGKYVNVYSEDAHVTKTLDGMLDSPDYAHLKPFIEVKSYKDKSAV